MRTGDCPHFLCVLTIKINTDPDAKAEMKIILTIIGLVLCVFFMKSIVRIIVWPFGFLMRNFIYVIIIVVLVVCLLKGCGGA